MNEKATEVDVGLLCSTSRGLRLRGSAPGRSVLARGGRVGRPQAPPNLSTHGLVGEDGERMVWIVGRLVETPEGTFLEPVEAS